MENAVFGKEYYYICQLKSEGKKMKIKLRIRTDQSIETCVCIVCVSDAAKHTYINMPYACSLPMVFICPSNPPRAH